MNPRRVVGSLAVVGVAAIVVVVLRTGAAGERAEELVSDVAVHAGMVTRATVRRYVTAYGYIEPAPAGDGRRPAGALLTSMVGGVLAESRAVEGQHVTAGTVLFTLDGRLAEVAVQKARQQMDFAERAFRRQQELLPSNGTSQRAFEEARQALESAQSDVAAAETALEYLRIAAPLTGTVVRVNATVGQHVDANTVLGEVIDLDRLIVSANAPRREMEGLTVGRPAFIGADGDGIEGVVTVLGKDVDPRTGTSLVQVSVPAGAGLQPGAFTVVRIVAEEHANVFVVPEVSVVTRAGEGSWVLVMRGDSIASRSPVTVGLRDRGLVEVSGADIAEGTTVVTEDAYSLPEETRVRIVDR